uniref:J domain-containing protein n=1 Tax=Medicago truncatula TaxID=3880 RepID=I3SHY9_MEDTR|nr:unknown [Medicago truncatula]
MSTPFFYLMAATDDNNNNKPKDYYKVLEIEYDATDEDIRLNYRRLALKWHPDKHKDDSAVTAKFQEINEAYNVLNDPAKRLDYDLTGACEIEKYSLQEYLARFKGMILTCNGLGINNEDRWSQQLIEDFQPLDK